MMSHCSHILWALALLVAMLVVAHRWQRQERTPITLRLARGLRRWARALWCLSEGVEVGFHHGRRVKDKTSLELELPE
jgi:hypothetical protein